MAKRITMADVAREAGVSLQTVSRAINNKGEIREETRERILEVVDRLGFHPSGIARSLATRRTASIGLVVPDITNPFFSEIARGVEDIAYANAYNVFLCNTDEDTSREKTVLASLLEKQVDGLVLFSPRLDRPYLEEVLPLFPSVVLVNRKIHSAAGTILTIAIDDQHGAELAVEHLIRRGRQTIGFIAGPERSESGKNRLKGFIAAHEKHNLPMHEDLIIHCKPDTASGQQAAQRILERRPDATALFAYNDLLAFGALLACKEAGRRVPEDVAVVGCDDIPLSSFVTPALTTLQIPKREIGITAMQILIGLMEGGETGEKAVFQPVLVVRDSAP